MDSYRRYIIYEVYVSAGDFGNDNISKSTEYLKHFYKTEIKYMRVRI